MLPIQPVSQQSRFRRLLKDNKPALQEDSFEQTQQRLNRRLKAIRDGFEPGPISGMNNMIPEDIEVLNDNSDKRQRYGSVCFDCQDVYKKNSYLSREVIIYRDSDKKVEISS